MIETLLKEVREWFSRVQTSISAKEEKEKEDWAAAVEAVLGLNSVIFAQLGIPNAPGFWEGEDLAQIEDGFRELSDEQRRHLVNSWLSVAEKCLVTRNRTAVDTAERCLLRAKTWARGLENTASAKTQIQELMEDAADLFRDLKEQLPEH